MKHLIFILISIIVLSGATHAQFKSDLAGNIVKSSEAPKTNPISIFSFQNSESNNGLISAQRTNPNVAFLSSAILPGAAQAANGKWARAGIYLATEAFSVFYYINRTNAAKTQERRYKAFANREWSVVAYAQWLVEYSRTNNINNGWQQLAAIVDGVKPNFGNTQSDWDVVNNIGLIQSIEQNSPIICASCNPGNKFSHLLPAYGSQQYYELISKYYQFEGGWSDFYSENIADPNSNYNFQYDNNGSLASDFFFLGASRADRFNNNYRRAGNILNLLVINHVVSAFDALFTVKLKNARIEPSANMMRADSFSLTLHF